MIVLPLIIATTCFHAISRTSMFDIFPFEISTAHHIELAVTSTSLFYACPYHEHQLRYEIGSRKFV
jgi:hypothetical protein